MRRFLVILIIGLTGCYRASPKLEVSLPPPDIQCNCERFSRSDFPPLTEGDLSTEWGKEMKVAMAFAGEGDFYRAITFFKRALIFLPEEMKERRLEVEYEVALAYYLGRKYPEVIESVASTDLCRVEATFPAYHDLLLILYDAYQEVGDEQMASALWRRIQGIDPEVGEKLVFFSQLTEGNLSAIEEAGQSEPYIAQMLSCYCQKRKSIKTAEWLNALLPGAGYFYVGQNQTAMTALVVNGLFIGAAYLAFDHGNIPLGVILSSLEMGWYFGGISGAGIAARTHNLQLYQCYAERIAKREQLYPVFMLHFTF